MTLNLSVNGYREGAPSALQLDSARSKRYATRVDFENALIAEAMTWVGTPFHKQGNLKGVGVNCGNFIDGVLTTIGVNTNSAPQNWGRADQQDGKLMLQLLEDNDLEFVSIEDRKKGDIIAFCKESLDNPDEPVHIAFVVDITHTTIIVEAGRKGVVRHRLNGLWNARIHSIWRIPDKLWLK